MFNPEKPKGLPGSRGLVYLVAGIVIGVLGVLGVMFMVTSASCACDSQPPTTIPLIPTPIPGVTGTAAAQSQVSEPQLGDFMVDEDKQQIALMYGVPNGRTTLEVRSWTNEGVGDVINVLAYGVGRSYTEVAFHPSRPALIASTTNGHYSTLFSIDDTRSPAENTITETVMYSSDGQWIVGWDEHELKLLDQVTFEPIKQIAFDGYWAQDAVFSPDGTQVAVIGQDVNRSNRIYIEVYNIPDLTRSATYNLTDEGGGFSAKVLLTPNHRSVIGVIRGAIYEFDFTSSQKRYFETHYYTSHAALDASGRWLAVDGSDQTLTQSSLMIYDLQQSDHLAPEPPRVFSLPGIPPHEQFQFLTDALLVGHYDMTFTLYHWTGETWGNPTVVMTEADLE